MDRGSGSIIVRRALRSVKQMRIPGTDSAWLARLVLMTAWTLVLGGCGLLHIHLRQEPLPEPGFVLNANIMFSGPLPVYSTYNGTDPLVSYLTAGLVQPGADILVSTVLYIREPDTHWGFSQNASITLERSIESYQVPAGSYDFVVCAEGAPGNPWSTPGNAGNIVLYRGAQVNVDYVRGSQQLGQVVLNFTGPGPYGSASGRILISGPIYLSKELITQLVLKPAVPLPGVNADTGLLWQADSSIKRHGYVPFEVPNLSYGDYVLSFAGSGLSDRDHPGTFTSIPITLSASQPNLTGINLNMSRILDPEPEPSPYQNPDKYLGYFSVTLILPAAPAPDAAYCVEIRSNEMHDPESLPSLYTKHATQQCLVAADFNAAHTAVYNSGLLHQELTYTINVFALPGSPAGVDELLGTFGPHKLSIHFDELAVVDVVLEVEP